MGLLNGPIEVGLRTVILLAQAFPASFDLGRLVVLDHCVVHSDLFGGPSSVHPNRPNSLGEIGLKRGLIEDGLQIMRRAGLVQVQAEPTGIFYKASEEATGFLNLMDAPLVRELEQRAAWALERFAGTSDDEVQRTLLGSLEDLSNQKRGEREPNE